MATSTVGLGLPGQMSWITVRLFSNFTRIDVSTKGQTCAINVLCCWWHEMTYRVSYNDQEGKIMGENARTVSFVECISTCVVAAATEIQSCVAP